MTDEKNLLTDELINYEVPENYKRPYLWTILSFLNSSSLIVIGFTFLLGLIFIPIRWIPSWVIDANETGFFEAIINWIQYFSAVYHEIIESSLEIVLPKYFFHSLFFFNVIMRLFLNGMVLKTKEWQKRSNESFFAKYKI